MRFIFSLLLPLTFFAGVAHADVLTGRTLDCRYDSTLGFGVVETQIQFVAGPRGESLAIVEHNGQIESTEHYRLVGASLTILDPNDPLVYDISNPGAIVRAVHNCVSPGYPDGNSKPACESAAEICKLQ